MIGPSDIQRCAPLTDLPMPGISTMASRITPPRKIQGANCCQKRKGIWKAISAPTSPMQRNTVWRIRKNTGEWPVKDEPSAVAIEAE